MPSSALHRLSAVRAAGSPMPAGVPTSELSGSAPAGPVFENLAARRSCSELIGPGPDEQQTLMLLRAAVTAPDYGRLAPWRFAVLREPGRQALGRALAELERRRCAATGRASEPERPARAAAKADRAPLVIVTAARRQPSSKIPWEDQIAAVAAATQNLLLAATALGFGSMWRTGPAARDPDVRTAVGLEPDDHIVGFVYLGAIPPDTRPSPRSTDLNGLVTWR